MAAITSAAPLLVDPWWIIGSGAALLIGLESERPEDIDLLTSERDARALCDHWQVTPQAPRPSALFRSTLFARYRETPIPIEIMACLRVSGSGWEKVCPLSRVAVAVRDGNVFVPDATEQAMILRMFGRKKDVGRAQRLENAINTGAL